jgi:hypothetical protein
MGPVAGAAWAVSDFGPLAVGGAGPGGDGAGALYPVAEEGGNQGGGVGSLADSARLLAPVSGTTNRRRRLNHEND